MAWPPFGPHYIDVIMTTVASQITSPMVVYSIVYSGADQRKHQSSASLGPVNSPHKRPVMWKMVPFDDVIMRKQLPEPMNTQYQLGPEEQTSVKSTIIPIQIIWMCRLWNIMVSTTRHLLPYSSMIWFTEIFVSPDLLMSKIILRIPIYSHFSVKIKIMCWFLDSIAWANGFHVCPSNILANEWRLYVANVFSHWLEYC